MTYTYDVYIYIYYAHIEYMRIAGLPMQQVQHAVTTIDVQPVPAIDGAFIIQVLGQLKVGHCVTV